MNKLRIIIISVIILLHSFTRVSAAIINIVDYGADNTGNIDATAVLEKCLLLARISKEDIYCPAGTYLLAMKVDFNPNSSMSDPLNPKTFYDWRNITIYGDGWKTVFNGTTQRASDTFNLYCVRNIHFRDFSVTNEILDMTPPTFGSNTISIINGENITFENIKAFDAKGVEQQTAFDGGKGFTVQSQYANNISFKNCYAYNCPSGFLMQYDNRETTNIIIDGCTAEKCQEGLYIGWAAGRIRGMDHTAITVDIDILNCMVGYRESIADGVKANIRVKNTQKLKRLCKNAQGRLWLSLPNLSYIRQASYAYFFYGSCNSHIEGSVRARQLNNILIFDNFDSSNMFVNGNNYIHIVAKGRIKTINSFDDDIASKDYENKKISLVSREYHLPFVNSTVIFDGFDEKDVPAEMIKKRHNNRVILNGLTL